ncbi:unnamed protein product, partial [marine sediment metagenome]
MSEHPRSDASDDQIPAEMADLVAAIAEIPGSVRTKITPHLDRVMESTRRR